MNKTFQEFSETFFNTYLKINPQAGTYLGLHEYDGMTGDISQKGIDEEIKTYKELYKELCGINRDELSDINKYDHDIAKWAIESELFELEEMQSYRRNPRVYINMISGLDDYIKREYAPFDDRFRSILSIMEKIPGILETAETNLGNKIPEVYCRYAKHSAKGFEDFFKNKLYNVIKERSGDEKLISEYNEKALQQLRHLRNSAASLIR
ncbi:MAG: DUF885 family protein [Ignavibacteria bacterium]|nr:DUF885 family protein [Ignavibacteria bacterium]